MEKLHEARIKLEAVLRYAQDALEAVNLEIEKASISTFVGGENHSKALLSNCCGAKGVKVGVDGIGTCTDCKEPCEVIKE